MPLPPLSPEQLIRPPRFDLRMALLYAAIYVPMGVHLPFFPVWLAGQGFDADTIALISALADRAPDRATVLVALVAGAFLVSLGFFLTPAFATVFAVSMILQILWSPQAPLADALALSGVRRFGSDYSRLRIWGSISFLVANLAAGTIIGRFGVGSIPAMISLGMAGAPIAALVAPRLGRPRRALPLSASDLGEARAVLKSPFFLMVVAGTGLTVASHGLLYAFGSIYWQSLGIGDATIGWLWAFSVVAEVLLFLSFRRVFSQANAASVLTVAAGLSMLRWAAFPLVWPLGLGVGGFLALQTLHAFSTGLTHLGVQKMIAATVAEEHSGAAQGIVFFANGFGMAAAIVASGPIYGALGGNGFFVMAALPAVGLVCALAAARLQPQRAGSGG